MVQQNTPVKKYPLSCCAPDECTCLLSVEDLKDLLADCICTLLPVLEAVSAEVLTRVDMQGESLKQTALTLRISPNEAKERLFSARSLLLKSLLGEAPTRH